MFLPLGRRIIFVEIKNGLDKVTKDRYHMKQLAVANLFFDLWLAMSNQNNLNQVDAYEFDERGRRQGVHHSAD